MTARLAIAIGVTIVVASTRPSFEAPDLTAERPKLIQAPAPTPAIHIQELLELAGKVARERRTVLQKMRAALLRDDREEVVALARILTGLDEDDAPR